MQQSLSGLLLDGLPPSASAAFLPKTGVPISLTLWLSACASIHLISAIATACWVPIAVCIGIAHCPL